MTIIKKMSCIVISNKRDCDHNSHKRKIYLKKLKLNEIHDIIKQYDITEKHELKPYKETLIDGIILYEKMLLGGKQTELIINIDNQNKSFFIHTQNKLVLVTRDSKYFLYTRKLN